MRDPYGTERLQEALIGWDIQAHRTLATTPTAANLLLVSRTQAGIATAAGAIVHAGARTGHVDTRAYQHRLAPTLDATQQAWTHLASRWTEMTTPADRTDPDLVGAAGELRAAVREVAHDKTTWARPEVMAGRVDLGQAAQHLQQALSTALDLAADPGHPAADVVWVTPSDVLANRTVAIPEPVRAGLVDATGALLQSASSAMSAAACLDQVTQERPPGPAQGPIPPRGSRPEVPTPMAQEVPRAARR